MSSIGAMAMPADFRYREVFLKGKPQHGRYDPFSIRHPQMNTGHRAKIFAPFDALKGFGEAVASKDVPYENRKEPDPEKKDELDRRLDILHNLTWNGRMARENHVSVSVTYYVPCSDENSEAYGLRGQYHTVTGICMNVDPDATKTVRVDRTVIEFEDILWVESPDGIFGKTYLE